MNPLVKRKFRKMNYFIFVDALPKKAHYRVGSPSYELTKDVKSYVRVLVIEAGKKGWSLLDAHKNTLHFAKGKRHMIYLYNTTVEESLKKKAFRRGAKHAYELHIAGFGPWDSGLTDENLDALCPQLSDTLTNYQYEFEYGYQDVDSE